MKENLLEDKMKEIEPIIKQFLFDGTYRESIAYGAGHINDTYRLTFQKGKETNRYILQKMNPGIAEDMDLLMDNIERVTKHIKGKNRQQTPMLIPTKASKNYYRTKTGECYRAFVFIEHAKSYDEAQSEHHMRECGRILGMFEKDLMDFTFDPKYVEMTKNFHDTRYRYEKLMQAVETDAFGRVKEAVDEIRFFIQRQELYGQLLTLVERERIPVRATHNDLRINNILIDSREQKGAALIDLDTVMPGLAAYDYGDAIRSAAKRVYYKDGKIESVEFLPHLAAAFTKGYLEEAREILTKEEIETLPLGIRTMSLELGMRYLTDYLNGDVYFKKNKDGKNLENARREIAFTKQVEQYQKELEQMVVRDQTSK